jgi:hypothetical protein
MIFGSLKWNLFNTCSFLLTAPLLIGALTRRKSATTMCTVYYKFISAGPRSAMTMTEDKNAPVKILRKRVVKSRTRSGCVTCKRYILN